MKNGPLALVLRRSGSPQRPHPAAPGPFVQLVAARCRRDAGGRGHAEGIGRVPSRRDPLRFRRRRLKPPLKVEVGGQPWRRRRLSGRRERYDRRGCGRRAGRGRCGDRRAGLGAAAADRQRLGRARLTTRGNVFSNVLFTSGSSGSGCSRSTQRPAHRSGRPSCPANMCSRRRRLRSNGTVYTGGAGSGGTLYAYAESSGHLNWRASVENGDSSSPVVTKAGVFVSYACPQTYQFNPRSGAQVWHYSGPCEGGGGSTAVLHGKFLYVERQRRSQRLRRHRVDGLCGPARRKLQ